MSRDIETLRRRLEEHRDVLRRLEQDAPAEALAAHYAQLADWIERRLASLAIAPPEPALPPLPVAAAEESPRPEPEYTLGSSYALEPEPRREGVRTGLVLLIGLAAAGLLAFLFFRFFAEDREMPAEPAAISETIGTGEEASIDQEPRIVEETAAPVIAPGPETEAAEAMPADAILQAQPPRANVSGFGAGRAIQQFRIENSGSDAVRITIERSRCRCLWYDVQPVIPAGGGVVLEVTVDGARLQGDRLAEEIGILEAGTRRRLAEIQISGYR